MTDKKYTEIVYNNNYGGFGLSDEAMMLYCKLKNITVYPEKNIFGTTYWLSPPDNEQKEAIYDTDIDRADPILVKVVKELKQKANGEYASLKIDKVLKGTLYRITQYDGSESIETIDNIGWIVA